MQQSENRVKSSTLQKYCTYRTVLPMQVLVSLIDDDGTATARCTLKPVLSRETWV